MCRAALFLPPTANLIEYFQYRFSDQSPQFFIWLMLNALLPCFSLAVIGRLAKKFGKKTLLLVGLAGYSCIDCLYAIVQESFYYAFGIASVFYAMALMCNPILDQYAAAEAGDGRVVPTNDLYRGLSPGCMMVFPLLSGAPF